MATAASPNTSQASQSSLLSTARALVIGLSWGGVMLFVFAFWMRSKYAGAPDGKIVTNLFFGAGGLALGLAIWQAVTLWAQKLTPEARAATLENQRRILSYVLLGGGIGLILLAFALGFERKAGNFVFNKDNFAETFGSLLLGLISLAFGYFLQQPLTSNESPIQFLVGKIHALKITTSIIAILCLGGFVYVFSQHRNDFLDYYPELLGLFLMSVLCIGCMLWLNTGQFDEFGIRLFVLVFGGVTGVVVFLMTLCRAYLWRQDILLGGATAWQGPNAWKFWLCAYVLFASLVLMFVSFNLARADIRKHVALRRVMYGYDAIVQGLLLVGMLGILNVVIFALVPFSFDWTKSRGAYALADASKNLIAGLKQEAHIFVLLPQNHQVSQDLRNLLDNCEAIATKERFQVEYVSPDLSQIKFQELLRRFPEIMPDRNIPNAGRGVLIVFGPMPTAEGQKVPNSFVPERSLYDQERPMAPGQKPKVSFKGEEAILKELKFLVEGRKKRKIYFLQGNGEVEMTRGDRDDREDFRKPMNKLGMEFLVDRLTADNYEVKGLTFNPEPPQDKKPDPNLVRVVEGKDKKKNIPDDCHTLIIAAASNPLPAEALDAIERYMDHRNGKMLVYVDVVADDAYTKLHNSGLEKLLKTYGVEVTDEFVIRQPERGSLFEALYFRTTPPPSTEQPLARKFLNRTLDMRNYPRIVRPAAGADGGRYKAETILQAESTFRSPIYIKKDVQFLNLLDKLLPYLNKMAKAKNEEKFAEAALEPVSLAVAVTDNEKKPRMVVFGDADFITNLDLVLLSRQQKTINYDMTLSALEWMAERESIGASPRERTVVTLDPSVDYWRMVLAPLWMMTLLFVGMGGAFWLVRRR